MSNDPALQPGDLLHCPHCRQWHGLAGAVTAEHEYVRSMLFFACRKGRYFAGVIGGHARYATKRAADGKRRRLVTEAVFGGMLTNVASPTGTD